MIMAPFPDSFKAFITLFFRFVAYSISRAALPGLLFTMIQVAELPARLPQRRPTGPLLGMGYHTVNICFGNSSFRTRKVNLDHYSLI